MVRRTERRVLVLLAVSVVFAAPMASACGAPTGSEVATRLARMPRPWQRPARRPTLDEYQVVERLAKRKRRPRTRPQVLSRDPL